MILVNFKQYEKTFKDGGLELAKICKKVMEKTRVTIYPVVSALDAYRISKEVGISVLLQHVDVDSIGKKTGKISGLQASLMGIGGSLLNHSEDKMPKGKILSILKQLPDEFITVLCVRSQKQAEFWIKKKVKYIAYEPAELIGSKTKSVATEKKEMIVTMVKLIAPLPLLVGAGIKSSEDVRVSLACGAKGILVSNAVVESDNPEKILLELTEGITNHGIN